MYCPTAGDVGLVVGVEELPVLEGGAELVGRVVGGREVQRSTVRLGSRRYRRSWIIPSMSKASCSSLTV
jgi:hypothetical protein